MPHNPSIIPTGHASEIPPITADAKLYDGNIHSCCSPHRSMFTRIADIAYVHMDLAEIVSAVPRLYIDSYNVPLQVHDTGYFLPWHRNYVHIFETILKDHCSYKGTAPYWNWTQGLFVLPLSAAGYLPRYSHLPWNPRRGRLLPCLHFLRPRSSQWARRLG